MSATNGNTCITTKSTMCDKLIMVDILICKFAESVSASLMMHKTSEVIWSRI